MTKKTESLTWGEGIPKEKSLRFKEGSFTTPGGERCE